MSEYPKRESHFAHRYCRLLTKTCAAQEIGPDGCWMLTVIALLEDSKWYSDAITFYNEQLMGVTGFTRAHTLIAVRDRAIKAGWLHYEQGGKRKPGRYWVTIPAQFSAIPDGSCDEGNTGFDDENVIESGGKASSKAEGKRHPFLPTPIPIPDVGPPNGDPPPKQVWDGDGWPLSNGSLYRLPLEVYERYRATYSFDIDADLRKCAQWCREHIPERSKTPSGQQRRITAWLNRTDDRLRRNGNGQAHPEPPKPKLQREIR